MVISAMVNLLADAGIVPSWSSASALVGKANAISSLRTTNFVRQSPHTLGKTSEFHHKTNILTPIQG
eukprot:3494608-Amphidinium_carterae.1